MQLFAFILFFLVSCFELRKHVRTQPPKGWTRQIEAPSTHQISFIIALKQKNTETLEKMFWDRSNPDSKNYQNWMSIQDIQSIVSPDLKSQLSVISWLTSYGISESSIKNYGDAIEVTSTVEILNKLFNCQFHIFSHARLGKLASIWGEYSTPKSLDHIIDMVVGISSFPPESTKLKRDKVPSQPKSEEKDNEESIIQKKRQIMDRDVYIVPQTLYTMYNCPMTIVTTNVSQGVIEFEEQYFEPQQLATFKQMMGVALIKPVTVVGNNNPNAFGIEATLDIQWIAATGVGAKNVFWIEAGSTWLYGFSTHFFNTQNIPMVASISYGWNEEDQCENGIGGAECANLGVNSTQYVSRVNVEFQKIGLRGVSLFAASGDSGANGRTNEVCTGSTSGNPTFPAASPFVTTVGATQVRNAVYNLPDQQLPPVCKNAWLWYCVSGGTETAVSWGFASFTSGGGFSKVAPMMNFQQNAVWAWMNSSAGSYTPTSYYNPNGRAYPDIAAFGSHILIWAADPSGSSSSVGGTSASSPIFAGIFTQLNDYSMQATGKPLGPLNQLIYKMGYEYPIAFNDITIGDNTCTETGCFECNGYYCSPGWDPVTGWGSPNYPEMLNYVKKMLSRNQMLHKQ